MSVLALNLWCPACDSDVTYVNGGHGHRTMVATIVECVACRQQFEVCATLRRHTANPELAERKKEQRRAGVNTGPRRHHTQRAHPRVDGNPDTVARFLAEHPDLEGAA